MKYILVLLAFLSGVAFAAPAVVVQVVATSESSASTLHTLNIGTPAAGERLLVVLPAAAGGLTMPAGFSLIRSTSSGNVFGAKCHNTAYYYDANGSEGASVNVTSVSSFAMQAVVYRISGHDASTAPAVSSNYGNSATPKPASLGAPWGVADNLWFASFCSTGGTLVSFPANYVNDQYGYNAPTFGVASRVVTAALDWPSSFVISAVKGWAAHTIAIKPAP